MEAVLFVVTGVMVLAVLDVAVWFKGADSGDDINAQEWERRSAWRR